MSTTTDDRPEEVIRLALVMNGGVSLAVWMGGVTHEINRLLARVAPPSQAWQDILSVTENASGEPRPRRRVVVDYVAGTSAGGLNGALLATAIARGADLDYLKDLWLDKGELKTGVMLPGGELRGVSVLDGDFFLSSILGAVGQATAGARDGQEVSLLVTATAMTGGDTFVTEDTNGNELEISDRRRVYLFNTAGRTRDPGGHFGDTDTLALAARASAGFPAAFAPVQESPDLANRRVGAASLDPALMTEGGQPCAWLIDGGVLDNAPFEPLLTQIIEHPRPEIGPRWVVYIMPSARVATADNPAAEPPPEPPAWSKVVTSLWGIKSEVDLRADLDLLRRLQAQSQAARVRPEQYIVSHGAGALDVTPLIESYRVTRAEGFVRFLQEKYAETELLGTRPLSYAQASALLDSAPLFIPTAPVAGEPLEALRGSRWQWGITVARRMVLWISRDTRTTGGDPGLVGHLAEAEVALRDLEQDVYALYTPQLAAATPAEVAAATSTAFDTLMESTGDVMVGAVAAWARSRGYSTQQAWYRLLSTEVVHNHDEWHARSAPPIFDVLLVNPGSDRVAEFALPPGHQSEADGFDGASMDPNAKLYGTQLGHFGAFGARHYREHDWLWGRLDAAACLTSALLKGVDQSLHDTLLTALVAEILDEELRGAGPDTQARRAALGEATRVAESLDGPGLLQDIFKRGEVDVSDLIEGIIDMALPTEENFVLDAAADTVISAVGTATDVLGAVSRGILRASAGIQDLAGRFLARLSGKR